MKSLLLSLLLTICHQISIGQIGDFKHDDYLIGDNIEVQRNDRNNHPKRFIRSIPVYHSIKHPGNKYYKAGTKQKLDNKINELWDSAGNRWMNAEKTVYDYDTSGKLLSDVFSEWDIIVWVNNYKMEFSYDASGNNTLIKYYPWNPIGDAWELLARDENTYDAKGNLLTLTYSEWDNTKSIWIKITRNEYTYDANDNLLSDIYLEWDAVNSIWVNFDKFQYTYNGNGNVLKDAYFVWNKLMAKWDNNDQYDYTYNGLGNKSTRIYSEWIASVWVNNEKEVYAYDAQDRLLTATNSVWNKLSSLWVNSLKTEYSYDVADNEIETTVYSWFVRDSKWLNKDKNQNSYDLTMSLDNLIWPYAYELQDVNFKNKPTQILSLDWLSGNSTWQNNSRLTFNYSDFGTIGLPVFHSNATIDIFPNPASGFININGIEDSEYEIRVFDSYGKLVVISDQEGQAPINLSHLKPGFYVVQVKSGKEQFGQKKVVIY
jgi:hypothetical protein